LVSSTRPLYAAVQNDPVTDRVRPPDVERCAGEDIAQRALQSEPDDDRDDARCGGERADRHGEHVGDHRKQCAGVDRRDHQILDQPTLSRLALEDQEDSTEGDQGPGGIDPPDDLGMPIKICRNASVSSGAGS
jgi:hypothetical protein